MYTGLLCAATLWGPVRMSEVRQPAFAAAMLVLSGLVLLAPVRTADPLRRRRDRAEAEGLRAERAPLSAESDRRGELSAPLELAASRSR
ncbi:hypothetical protein K353_03207 [Kitasatospora sp. SolWspMP-SS2h]|uniref:hypothetical protein n=1 Tax=Kitasatospora sp. SolWspMP-SS2h TaxID=1305729 RepID=UPI000DBA7C0E|nr:hypothetical protein [Kitasatospora sp. SolWspMP-SS2h]RAJ41446.1 hypothetical protein K353_03207 [Kitasatospora sp. SolWspMP-SS2h]